MKKKVFTNFFIWVWSYNNFIKIRIRIAILFNKFVSVENQILCFTILFNKYLMRRFRFSQERRERKLELPLSLSFHLLLLWCLSSVFAYFLEWGSQRIILKVSHLQSISFNVASLLSTYLRGVFLYQTVEIMYLSQYHWTCLFLKWFSLLNNKLFIVWKLWSPLDSSNIYIYIYMAKKFA